MKTLFWIMGAAVAALGFLAAIGSSGSPAQAQAYGVQSQADALCAQMMTDAAPGNERRNTREMCDALKAEAQRRIATAK